MESVQSGSVSRSLRITQRWLRSMNAMVVREELETVLRNEANSAATPS